MTNDLNNTGQQSTTVIIKHDASNALGIASFIFGLISIFILSPIFVPLAIILGIIAVIKKQLAWGITGLVCAGIGFITSPILLGMFAVLNIAALMPSQNQSIPKHAPTKVEKSITGSANTQQTLVSKPAPKNPTGSTALQSNTALAKNNAVTTSEKDVASTVLCNTTWKGTYFYQDSRPSNKFDVTFSCANGVLAGRMSELNTLGNKSASHLFADVSSIFLDSSRRHITFKKMYDGTGGVYKSVNYDGRLVSQNTVKGTWETDGMYGSFNMTKR